MAINFPEGTQNLPAQILQVKQTVKQSTFSETVNRNVETGSCGLDVTITPSTTSSKILLIIQTSIGFITDDNVGFVLKRGSTTLTGYLPTGYSSRAPMAAASATNSNAYMCQLSGNYLDSPSTTSAVTYSVRLKYARGDDNRTLYLNRTEQNDDASHKARSCSVITAMEVAS